MGIPVSGKNLFPSNIQGLPTWFTIRASKDGFIARRRDVGVLICMNPETAHDDVKTVAPGAAVIYEESLKLDGLRNDVHFYPVPFSKLVLELVQDGKLRRLAVNMIYVGVAAWLLDIDMAEIEKAVAKQFKSKAAAVEINMKAIRGGFEWAEKNLKKSDPFRLERMNATAGKIIIEGNAATAIGCMMAGVQFLAWYPITPSSSLARVAHRLRRTPPHRSRNGPAHVLGRAGRGRARRARHGARGRLGGRARHDDDLRARDLAHVRVHGPGLLRRGPRGHRRRPARRALDGPADADDAGRHHVDLLPRPRRREAHPPHPGLDPGVLRARDGRLRPRRALSDAGLPDDGSRSRDEQLDGGPVLVSRQSPSTGARSCGRKKSSRPTSRSSASSPATGTSTETASPIGRCPASSTHPRRRTSPAARATPTGPRTPSAATTTRTTWTASRGSSRRPGSTFRSR